MLDNEIVKRVNTALAAEFELDIEDMVPEASFKDDLGLDSLDAVDMVIVLEQEFGFKIGKDSKILEIRKLADLYTYVIDKRNLLVE
ncbi:acyl carrier protein [Nitratidesulfovibrio vulgaris]|uniref:acyl carrier protein n=1 Tax=Nitratidesulfovibrio vulgaris TaxID=881 RepID=UPI0023001675|nr:phosphopantetheine-binding protein [Nitratidesulfovibrio vulgaris]WCB47067.1 phosphopantetheine-binding protein [Nitratidesulfovibrio vulgaris]